MEEVGESAVEKSCGSVSGVQQLPVVCIQRGVL